ncbi:MAG: hypothetical protein ACK41D_00280 [Rubricoccaceae bacterium]
MRRFVLNTLYPFAISGLPLLGTPQALAADMRRTAGDRAEQAQRLVARHIAASGTAGFLSGLGGFFTLPIVLPANLAGVALVQLHMAASVAALAGLDPKRPDVKRRVVDCLVGTRPAEDNSRTRAAEDEAFDRIGLKLAERGLNFVLTNAIGAATWAGKRAAGRVQRRLVRGVPVLGGVIGAVSDGYVTLQVARNAFDAFLDEGGEAQVKALPPSSGDGLPEDVPAPPRPASA